MRQVSHKRGGDDDGAGRHLAEGDAVHERPRVHPSSHVNDLLEHERKGSETASEGKNVDLHHEEGQSENVRTDKVEKDEPE